MQLSARKGFAIGMVALTFGLVACDPNVDYLRAGSVELSGAGGGGISTSGSGGTVGGSGSGQAGVELEAGNGGDTSEGGAAGDGATGGSTTGGSTTGGSTTGGSATGGGAGATSLCTQNQPKLVELFAFDQATPPVANVVDGSLAIWQKGAYDSTDTNTGLIDSTATPPANQMNLANLSKLELDGGNGSPLPSMKVSIPFSGKNVLNPATQRAEPEHMHLIYIFAQSGQPANTVDFTARRFTADVMAMANPRAA
jgi:hypothetical protein